MSEQLSSVKNPSKCSRCCKQFMRIMFSHVGMIFLVVFYIVGGAFLFQLLEEHSLIQRCQEGQGVFADKHLKLRTYIFNYIWLNRSVYEDPYAVNGTDNIVAFNAYYNKTKVFEENFDRDMEFKIREYVSDIYSISSNRDYSNSDNTVSITKNDTCLDDKRWTLISALLFSMTAISTIGILSNIVIYLK